RRRRSAWSSSPTRRRARRASVSPTTTAPRTRSRSPSTSRRPASPTPGRATSRRRSIASSRDAGPPRAPGAVERAGRGAEEVLGADAVGGHGGDADRDGWLDDDAVALEAVRRDGAADLLGELDRRRRVGAGQEGRELVAAEAADLAAVLEARREEARHLDEG